MKLENLKKIKYITSERKKKISMKYRIKNTIKKKNEGVGNKFSIKKINKIMRHSYFI